MQRRKMLAALGSAAIGGATAVSTGAFTSVQAQRDVSVAVADDADALLGLTTGGDGVEDADNAAYVDTSGSAVSINVDDAASVDGTGVNANATTQINDLFKVVNQGTQAAVVYVDPDSIAESNRTLGDAGSGITIDPQASNRPNGDYTNTSGLAAGVEDDQISLTGGFNGPTWSPYQEDGTEADALEEFVLAPGQAFDFGLYVSTDDTVDSETSISATLEIIADATRVPDGFTSE